MLIRVNALEGRYLGALLGLACGDAVGTTVEFRPRGSFPLLTDMVGGGPFRLAAGQWTDDTSMALCLAASLLHNDGFEAGDQMRRYVDWWQHGYLSATGTCFDIGRTVTGALQRFRETGEPMAGSSHPDTAGNGSLMRLAPVVLFFHPDRNAVRAEARRSSATTHGTLAALECCEVFAEMLDSALLGVAKSEVLTLRDSRPTLPEVRAILTPGLADRSAERIRGTGYCVASLEAALWCFVRTESFRDAVLLAANLGDDADTTAAIVGQIAGAHYGVEGIPAPWLERLHMRSEIEGFARGLFQAAQRRR